MNRKNHLYPAILIVCSVFLCSCSQTNSGWPQFRGPESNMIANGNNLPAEWKDSLNIKWSFDLTGAGWSSPIVIGNKIFITSAFLEKAAPVIEQPAKPTGLPPASVNKPGVQQGPPPPPKAEDNSYTKEVYRWELTCIDLNSGKELWKRIAHTGSPRIKKHSANNYACETPVSDGKRVYAYFGMTGVFCFDLNGNPLWQKDLGAFQTLNGWGTGSSPVVYKDLLFIQDDNEERSFLVALDAVTGNEKWRVDRDEKTNYSTPVIWKNKAGTELVTTGKTSRSYDPVSGKLNWELKMGGEMAIPSPVFNNDRIYLGNAGGREQQGSLYSIKAGSRGDITPADSGLVSSGVEWTIRDAGISNPSPLLYKDLLYLLSGRSGELTCFDAATGALVYKEKIEKAGAFWASPWANRDKIFFYDEKGVTQVIQAGKEFKVLGQNTLDDKFWASVAITNDAYIFRGVKKLYCIKK